MGRTIQDRKLDHLKICREMDVEFKDKTTLLEDVELVHGALAEGSVDEVSLETRFMGKTLRAPLLIGAMSGGPAEAESLNRDLARAAQQLGIGFCLGSQRPMLEDSSRTPSYEVRGSAPDILLLGNIGIQQAASSPVSDLVGLATSIGADGLAVHLNPAHELSQKEGDRSFPRSLKALSELANRLPDKILVKETGCGISREVAVRLRETGIRHIEVAGAGGTSWSRVESLRTHGKDAPRGWLDEWGIPTAASLIEVSHLGLRVVGSGGVRSGLDVAKCLVLGADACAMALPVLRAHAAGGYGGAVRFLKGVIEELRSVMLLVGAKDLESLRRRKPVIKGTLAQWQSSRK